MISRQEKRNKIIVATLVSVLAIHLLQPYTLGQLVNSSVSFFLLLAIALIGLAIMVWWVVDGDTRYHLLPPVTIPALIYLTTSYVAVSFFSSGWRFVALLPVGIGYYVLLLALNVLYISTSKKLPLKKASLSALYLLGIIMLGSFALIVVGEGWGINHQTLGLWIMSIMFAYSYLRLVHLGKVGYQVLVFAIISLEVILLTNLWPAILYMSVIAVVGWLFVLIGVLQHHLQKDLTDAISREYTLFSIILLLGYLLI